MKRNLNQVLKSLDGTDMRDAPDREMVDQQGRVVTRDGVPLVIQGKPVMLRDLCANVLQSRFQDEPNLTGEELAKRGLLALRIYDAKEEVDLTSEDIVLLKKLLAKMYGPVAIMRAFAILEPADSKE